jgi:hypothetical protein
MGTTLKLDKPQENKVGGYNKNGTKQTFEHNQAAVQSQNKPQSRRLLAALPVHYELYGGGRGGLV